MRFNPWGHWVPENKKETRVMFVILVMYFSVFLLAGWLLGR